ncbi:hypothetical protein BJ508DRAFT_326608 [Ascobolus immersus RN42]|uniref:Uncharacterized protein n=1 Tax=Ascobolus immersus RN42 TaxID=1160509 RepID=A0A3N4I553_ASCIM|nr:hypothetical protein BJ508DRAFT_326608 [Ascobolus immersus RN42]
MSKAELANTKLDTSSQQNGLKCSITNNRNAWKIRFLSGIKEHSLFQTLILPSPISPPVITTPAITMGSNPGTCNSILFTNISTTTDRKGAKCPRCNNNLLSPLLTCNAEHPEDLPPEQMSTSLSSSFFGSFPSPSARQDTMSASLSSSFFSAFSRAAKEEREYLFSECEHCNLEVCLDCGDELKVNGRRGHRKGRVLSDGGASWWPSWKWLGFGG